MSKILVIGYGNSLAGDDAVGFYAVQKLVGSELPDYVTVKYIHQFMPEHAEEIAECDLLICIDAEVSGSYGELKCKRLSADNLHDTGTAAHDYTLESILLLAKQLFVRIPEVYLITLSGKSFLTSDRLTPEVEKRLPDVIDNVFSIINRKKHLMDIPVLM